MMNKNNDFRFQKFPAWFFIFPGFLKLLMKSFNTAFVQSFNVNVFGGRGSEMIVITWCGHMVTFPSLQWSCLASSVSNLHQRRCMRLGRQNQNQVLKSNSGDFYSTTRVISEKQKRSSQVHLSHSSTEKAELVRWSCSVSNQFVT